MVVEINLKGDNIKKHKILRDKFIKIRTNPMH